MKYLKRYNEGLRSNPDAARQEKEFIKSAEESRDILSLIKDDVEDILLEVSDEGFDVKVSVNRWHRNEPFFTSGGLQDGWLSELRYSMVIHIVKKGLAPGESMYDNRSYYFNTIKEPLTRLEGYVTNNLPGYKLKYSDGVDSHQHSRISLVVMTIDNYADGVLPPDKNY